MDASLKKVVEQFPVFTIPLEFVICVLPDTPQEIFNGCIDGLEESPPDVIVSLLSTPDL